MSEGYKLSDPDKIAAVNDAIENAVVSYGLGPLDRADLEYLLGIRDTMPRSGRTYPALGFSVNSGAEQ